MEAGKEGEILDSLVEITKHKDIELLEITLAKTIFELFDTLGVSFFRVLKDGARIYSIISVSENGVSMVQKKEDIDTASAPFLSCFKEMGRTRTSMKTVQDDREIEIRPIVFRKMVMGFLVISLRPGSALDDNVVSGFLTVYENYHELLMDYQHDTLTGLLNRKTFEERLYRLMELQSAEKGLVEPRGSKRISPESSWGFWLGMFDIDNFKRINDTYGHVYGDEVLILIAVVMKQSFRPPDIKLRFGGEEFIVVIRARDKADAVKVFDRFRRSIEKRSFGLAGTVTVSVGLARIDSHEAVANLVGRADQALYHAKKTGKNRVCVYEDLVEQGLIDTKKSYGDIVLF